MSRLSTRLSVILGAIVLNNYCLTPVTAQAFACSTVADCIRNSTLSCQDWIDAMTNWQGDCCSFQDVNDPNSDVKCQLIIAGPNGATCGWVDPALACAPDATSCVYAGEIYSVFEEGTECPPSNYWPFAVEGGTVTDPPEGDGTTENTPDDEQEEEDPSEGDDSKKSKGKKLRRHDDNGPEKKSQKGKGGSRRNH